VKTLKQNQKSRFIELLPGRCAKEGPRDNESTGEKRIRDQRRIPIKRGQVIPADPFTEKRFKRTDKRKRRLFKGLEGEETLRWGKAAEKRWPSSEILVQGSRKKDPGTGTNTENRTRK